MRSSCDDTTALSTKIAIPTSEFGWFPLYMQKICTTNIPHHLAHLKAKQSKPLHLSAKDENKVEKEKKRCNSEMEKVKEEGRKKNGNFSFRMCWRRWCKDITSFYLLGRVAWQNFLRTLITSSAPLLFIHRFLLLHSFENFFWSYFAPLSDLNALYSFCCCCDCCRFYFVLFRQPWSVPCWEGSQMSSSKYHEYRITIAVRDFTDGSYRDWWMTIKHIYIFFWPICWKDMRLIK